MLTIQEKPEFLAKIADNLKIKEDVKVKEVAVVDATKIQQMALLV